jgi:hypothetical protein
LSTLSRNRGPRLELAGHARAQPNSDRKARRHPVCARCGRGKRWDCGRASGEGWQVGVRFSIVFRSARAPQRGGEVGGEREGDAPKLLFTSQSKHRATRNSRPGSVRAEKVKVQVLPLVTNRGCRKTGCFKEAGNSSDCPTVEQDRSGRKHGKAGRGPEPRPSGRSGGVTPPWRSGLRCHS